MTVTRRAWFQIGRVVGSLCWLVLGAFIVLIAYGIARHFIAWLLTLSVLLCMTVNAAAALRIRCEELQDDGKLHMTHGTCCVVGGKVLTAAHLLERDDKSMRDHAWVETKDAWVWCDLDKRVKGKDLVWLKPRLKIADTHADGDGCYASVAMQPVKRLKIDGACIRGFDEGGSGSPVYRDGRLVAIAVGIGANETVLEMLE